ncbi:MAG: anhydro-N-acetylmuramic acid kinase [Planctomycetes bacterium]|nr:anhydro-N-acetylmuramic acid kinase [Planctomycetota bacterium]
MYTLRDGYVAISGDLWNTREVHVAARSRLFLGLYSGPAADGIDGALVEISGRKGLIKARQVHHDHLPYDENLRQRLMNPLASNNNLAASARLDRDLGLAFAAAAVATMTSANVRPERITAVGSSGQLLFRAAPDGHYRPTELVLGSAKIIACQTGLPVVDDFSAGDLALGGCGCVWAWPGWRLFAHKRLSRVVVHLGGIAEITFIGSNSLADDTITLDIGYGTLILDALAREMGNAACDLDGSLAAGGKVCGAVVNEMLSDGFFRRRAPKAACPTQWGMGYLKRVGMIAEKHKCDGTDLMATATEVIASAVARAVAALTERPHELILTGGGSMNIHLAERIRTMLSPSSTYGIGRYGFHLRAYRAVCCAMLAAARLDEYAAHCPQTSGASRKTVLGSICLP